MHNEKVSLDKMCVVHGVGVDQTNLDSIGVRGSGLRSRRERRTGAGRVSYLNRSPARFPCLLTNFLR